MQRREVDIAELNRQYEHEWALNDFLVTDERFPVNQVKHPVRVNAYIIGICLRGKVSIAVNNVIYQLGANFMLVARPLQLFHLVTFTDDCRLRFTIFSKRFLIANNIGQQVFDKFQFSYPYALPVIEVEEKEAKNMVREFKFVWERFQQVKHPFRKEIVSSLLIVLLYEFEAIYRKHVPRFKTKGTRGKELTKQFIELVQKHFRKEHSVGFYAKALHITPQYLTTIIKKATGRPASSVISEAITIEAQALLQQINISVKEASNLLHFPDQSTFGKFFKRAVGKSPLAYKKSIGH